MIRHPDMRSATSRLAALCVMLSVLLAPSSSWGQPAAGSPGPDPAVALRQASAAELLAALRLRPLPAATAAPNARLPMVHPSPGELLDLSADTGEDWLLVVFVASWCPPCLDRLAAFQALEDLEGLAVRAVSVDPLSESQEGALRESGITYEVLVDDSGQAAERYGVSSLPVSFLVRRPGAVVGMLRGLRDVAAEAPVLAELMRRSELQVEPGGFTDTPLRLPAELEAPTARVVDAPKIVRPDQDFVVDVRIEWSGELDRYVPQAPDVRVSSPDGVVAERTGVAARSRGEAGRGVVDYTLSWRARGEGELVLDPVLVRYVPRYEGLQLFARAEGVRIDVSPPVAARWWPLGLVVVLTLGGLALLAWSRARRPAAEAEADPFAEVRSQLDRARRARLEGSFAEALEALVRAGEELRERDPEAAGAIGELAILNEQVRFGGVVPPGDELDRIHRLLERSCERLRPDPSVAEREALQLQ